MFITQVYKYEKDGVVYVGGEVPEGATILLTMDILNAEKGLVLVHKSDGEEVGVSIWLRDGDSEDNYTEAEPKPEPEPEPEPEEEPEENLD